ncbi:hypothetical protein EIB18_18675 [Caulobacter vibrioides]|nr:hypothetical protein CA608_18550 [Caulobacter vibrioides]AZH14514.1 hypothetical protein EIB18_18675 [Caulobacter vibrioides]PLR12204.1 hypothetical protein CVUC_08170 [Caulobacter vibrioides]
MTAGARLGGLHGRLLRTSSKERRYIVARGLPVVGWPTRSPPRSERHRDRTTRPPKGSCIGPDASLETALQSTQ